MSIFEILLLPIVSVVIGFGVPATIITIRNFSILLLETVFHKHNFYERCEKIHIVEKILYTIIGITFTVAYSYAQYKLKGILVLITSSVIFMIIYLIIVNMVMIII